MVLVIIAVAFCAFLFQYNLASVMSWVGSLGLFAPIFFLMLYCLATIFFLPTMILTMAGGVLFGPVVGTLFNLFGATFGAASAFLISRYWAASWVASKKSANVNRLIAGVERQGWQFVALLRLIPIIPFNLVNYGLGLTRIKFSHYLVTTLIFLIPAEIVFTYCGYAGVGMIMHPQSMGKWHGLAISFCLIVLLLGYMYLKKHHRLIANREIL